MYDQPIEKPLSRGELIIVAIILAILSAILVPQYSRASADDKVDMMGELHALRAKLAAYRRSHDNDLPPIFHCGATTVDGAQVWDELECPPMRNPLNGMTSICLIDDKSDFADGSDVQASGSGNRTAPLPAGWIVNTSTGRAWATATNPRKVFNEGDPVIDSNYAAAN